MNAADVVIVHEADLRWRSTRGSRWRAHCPIHGGDSGSLSVNAPGSELAGLGWCHNARCHAKVFVPELAPADRARGTSRIRKVTAETLLRPRRPMPSEPTPAEWQRDELAKLTRWYPQMCKRLGDTRARAYLEARGIPYDVAADAGVGYIPADAKLSGALAKWRDRIIFPLGSPAGPGYAGRSLHGWVPGMDENAHKELLDSDPNGPRRWEKTYPAGWFGYDALDTAPYMVVVEGPFDRLALVAADLALDDVLALVGTAARPEWIPANVEGVVLALDGDGPGRERAETLRHELRVVGIKVPEPCTPAAEDGRGKDWAERWRVAGLEGVYPVLSDLDALAGAGEPVTLAEVAEDVSVPDMAASTPVEALEAVETVETPEALARADIIVRYLLAHGHELVEVIGAAPEQGSLF